MDALVHCAAEVRRHDYDRYLCATLAPAPARGALLALYAFNLELARIREMTREPLVGQIRLQWWRDALASLGGGSARPHPVMLALVESGLGSPEWCARLQAQVDGREADLVPEPPATLAALERYAANTSGALAELALRALGVEEPVALAVARAVGTAWALVGLMRARAIHAAQGRSFLPGDLMVANGFPTDGVDRNPVVPDPARVVGGVLDLAAVHLARARDPWRAMPRAAIPVLALARLADLYRRRLVRSLSGQAVDDGPPLLVRQWQVASVLLLGRY
ncbi:MAG: squalene/phytoene synthase family protein [Alphaproteobacteria bacterium]|nr:squalene/phytoene synthase family protein [Alphaproteobacteria bacterium]